MSKQFYFNFRWMKSNTNAFFILFSNKVKRRNEKIKILAPSLILFSTPFKINYKVALNTKKYVLIRILLSPIKTYNLSATGPHKLIIANKLNVD